jgi:hypothetical protein
MITDRQLKVFIQTVEKLDEFEAFSRFNRGIGAFSEDEVEKIHLDFKPVLDELKMILKSLKSQVYMSFTIARKELTVLPTNTEDNKTLEIQT